MKLRMFTLSLTLALTLACSTPPEPAQPKEVSFAATYLHRTPLTVAA